MNAIKIIKQNARMWLGPKYTKQEFEINEYIQVFANQCIKDIIESNNDEKKAPRTGFKKPTEKEKEEFDSMFKCKKCKSKKVRSSRGLVCSKYDIKN
jgi:copper oxidase (laccase) domain-containing protein